MYKYYNISFIFSVPDDCCGFHLQPDNSPLPWLPKRTTNVGISVKPKSNKAAVPPLLPIKPKGKNVANVISHNVNNLIEDEAAGGLIENQATNDREKLSTASDKKPVHQGNVIATCNQEMYATKVKLNAEIMKELEVLRSKQNELVSSFEKVSKEKEFFKAKLEKATEQMNFLKKKSYAKDENDAKENSDPNQQ